MTTFDTDKVTAAGGAAFTLLAVATLVVAPPAPDVDASASKIRSYLVDEHDRFGASVASMALAVLALCLVFGYLYRRIRAAAGASALPAALVVASGAVVSMALSGVLFQAVLAQHTASGIDDSTLLALYRTWQVFAFMGPPLPVAVVLVLAAIATFRYGILPRWSGWLALVAAIGGASTALLNLATDTTAPVVLDVGSFLLCCAWLTTVTITAMTRTERTPMPDHPSPALPA